MAPVCLQGAQARTQAAGSHLIIINQRRGVLGFWGYKSKMPSILKIDLLKWLGKTNTCLQSKLRNRHHQLLRDILMFLVGKEKENCTILYRLACFLQAYA